MALVFGITSPSSWGDTSIYSGEIIDAARTHKVAPLFEFGHLFWRPLGYLLYQTMPASLFQSEPELRGDVLFLLPNLIGGLICAYLFYRIAWLISKSIPISFLTSAALVCANSFLNWSEAGTSYIAGLALLTASFWVLFKSASTGGVSTAAAIAGALWYVAAVLIWFPYITVAPGFVAILLFCQPDSTRSWKSRLLRASEFTVITIVLTLAIYYAAFRYQGYTSRADLSTWIQSAAHGMRPTGAVIRFIQGFPRGFVEMGHDGIMFKRYLLHDPYAQVTWRDLLGSLLLKLAVFYAFFGFLLWRLMVSREGRPILWILLSAGVPLIFFALFIFDSSSTERYFPLFPFLLAATAFLLSRLQKPLERGGILFLLAIMCVFEIQAYRSSPNGSSGVGASVSSLRALKGSIPQNSVIWVSSTLDPAFAWVLGRPFDPLNRPHPLPIAQVISVGTDQVTHWRESFRSRSLAALAQNGEIWISNQLLTPAPRREWNWTEGDVPGVHWTDLPEFFSPFSFDRKSGGVEGFSRIAAVQSNRDRLALQ